MPDNNYYIDQLKEKRDGKTQIFDLHDKRIENLDNATKNQVLAVDENKKIIARDVPLDIENGEGIKVSETEDGTFNIAVNPDYSGFFKVKEREKLSSIEDNAQENKIEIILDSTNTPIPIDIQDKSVKINKDVIGLSKVDNTSDAEKPISTAVKNALREKITEEQLNEKLSKHTSKYDNPHQVSKEQIGLSNVDNTSDMDKPISTEVKEALEGKLDISGGKVEGNIELALGSTVIIGKAPVEQDEVANKAYVDQQIQQSSSGQFIIVNTLPDLSKAKRGAIYLVPKENETNVYEKWTVTQDESGTLLKWTDLGSTNIDLSGYIQKPANPKVNQILKFVQSGKWEARNSGIELDNNKLLQNDQDVTSDVKKSLGVDNLNYVKYDTDEQNLTNNQKYNAQKNIGIDTIISTEVPSQSDIGVVGQKWVYIANDNYGVYTIEYICVKIDDSDSQNIKYIWKSQLSGLHVEEHTLMGVGLTADSINHVLRVIGNDYYGEDDS